MIQSKLKTISPNQALEQFGVEAAEQYLRLMLEQLNDAEAAQYLATHYYQGNLQLGQREILRMRHKAPFARMTIELDDDTGQVAANYASKINQIDVVSLPKDGILEEFQILSADWDIARRKAVIRIRKPVKRTF